MHYIYYVYILYSVWKDTLFLLNIQAAAGFNS